MSAARLVWLPPLAISAVLVLYPLALVLATPLAAPGGFAVLGSSLFLGALVRTVWIALCSTAGCLVLGFTLAVLIGFVPFRGAALAARLVDSIIALPTFLVALAFTFVYGAAGLLNGTLLALSEAGPHALPPVDFLYSQWGVVLAEVTVYTPFVLRPLLAAFAQLEPAQIEIAGSLGARPWRIVRRIVLPAALPALLAGGSLCLLLTVNEFGIVFFIGAKGVITLPLLVYDKAIQEFDYPAACAIAGVNLALSLALFATYRALLRIGTRGSGGRG
ncbi:MAG: 2-aminoethylphosphonate ABC transporter permease subunit [Rhodospirillales bacterium 70-18]|nr:MAG: 2-aminoethylphosphonate ABC transporter permease subunit [Rhodospirillales bacterium 70-18]